MAPSEPLWINASGGVPEYNAPELRRANAMMLLPGVADRFGARQGVRPHSGAVVTVSGTMWTVQHCNAVVYPGLGTDDGPYIVAHPSESDSLNPADGSNDRIDGLDLQIQDDDEDASGERRAHVVYVPGTPAGSPSAPAVTVNSLRLATILVPSGGSPSPSVQTLAPFTVALGGVLPVLTDADGPSAGRYTGMYRDRADSDGTPLERWSGSAWTPAAAYGLLPGGVAEQTTAQGSIAGLEVALTGLSVTVDVPASRRVYVVGKTSFFSASPPGNFELRLQRNGSNISADGKATYSGIAGQVVGSTVAKLDTPGAGTHVYRLVAIRVSGGGGDGTSQCSAANPAYLYAFDGGPA